MIHPGRGSCSKRRRASAAAAPRCTAAASIPAGTLLLLCTASRAAATPWASAASAPSPCASANRQPATKQSPAPLQLTTAAGSAGRWQTAGGEARGAGRLGRAQLAPWRQHKDQPPSQPHSSAAAQLGWSVPHLPPLDGLAPACTAPRRRPPASAPRAAPPPAAAWLCLAACRAAQLPLGLLPGEPQLLLVLLLLLRILPPAPPRPAAARCHRCRPVPPAAAAHALPWPPAPARLARRRPAS